VQVQWCRAHPETVPALNILLAIFDRFLDRILWARCQNCSVRFSIRELHNRQLARHVTPVSVLSRFQCSVCVVRWTSLVQRSSPVTFYCCFQLPFVCCKVLNECHVWRRPDIVVGIAAWVWAGILVNRASIPGRRFLIKVKTRFRPRALYTKTSHPWGEAAHTSVRRGY
jgi:hypothetical protein